MSIQSLGLKSSFIFYKESSEIDRQEFYFVVKTRETPAYFLGNFILFDRQPKKEELEQWIEVFSKEFSDFPSVKNICLVWSHEMPVPAQGLGFSEKGFKLMTIITMVLTKPINQASSPSNAEIRQIEAKNEWAAVLDQQLLLKPGDAQEDAYEETVRAAFKHYKNLAKKGSCKWMGAFVEGKLIGSLGFMWEDNLLRFQKIVVDPCYRNQGVCTKLLQQACNYGFKDLGVQQIVVQAKKDNQEAYKLYEKLGFQKENEEICLAYKYLGGTPKTEV